MKNSKKMILVSVVVLGTALFMNGCASVGNKFLKNETTESIDQRIVKGQTTKEQIKSMFGDPISSDFTDSGNLIWHYKFTKTHAKATNFIPIVNLFARGSKGDKKELVIFFDQKGIVQNYSMSTSKVDYHEGIIQ